jgi:hypothetical protein
MCKKKKLPQKIEIEEWLEFLDKQTTFEGGIDFDTYTLDVDCPTEEECDERILQVLNYIEDIRNPDLIKNI